MRRSRSQGVLLAACLQAASLAAAAWLVASPPALAAATAQPPSREEGWRQVKKLADGGSFEKAMRLAAELREQARAAGDEEGWTFWLARETQLRTAWHGARTGA